MKLIYMAIILLVLVVILALNEKLKRDALYNQSIDSFDIMVLPYLNGTFGKIESGTVDSTKIKSDCIDTVHIENAGIVSGDNYRVVYDTPESTLIVSGFSNFHISTYSYPQDSIDMWRAKMIKEIYGVK